MPLNQLISIPNPMTLPPVKRARHWWQRQNPQRQDRVAVMVPLASVLLFFAAIVTALGYLRVEEIDREQEAVQRDVEYTQQRLRLRLLERQEQFLRLGRDISAHEPTAEAFRNRAAGMLNQYPELQGLAWLDEHQRLKAGSGTASHPLSALHSLPHDPEELAAHRDADAAYNNARKSLQPTYLQNLRSNPVSPMLEIYIPLTRKDRFSGVVLAEISVDGLYRYGVPDEVTSRYAISLLDGKGSVLAGTVISAIKTTSAWLPWATRTNAFSMPVLPVGRGLVVRGQAYRASLGVIGSGLFWLVSALSVMTAWMLIANWQHTRRRHQTQQALIAETNFRRAMENSMLTGMRAMDLNGRITYVNTAFCQMTGWTEVELIGRSAPFPYWPEADRDMLAARLEEELSGRSTPGGFQVRVKRRDNSMFDARLYVAPLIDAMGTQAGWVTSMTDITEPNRVRNNCQRHTNASPRCWRRWMRPSQWRHWAATSCCLPINCTANGSEPRPTAPDDGRPSRHPGKPAQRRVPRQCGLIRRLANGRTRRHRHGKRGTI